MMQTISNKPSFFVTFEGGEGAGKTTQIDRLEKELQTLGYRVVKTREPGGSKLGNQIRQWLLNRDAAVSVGLKAELLLFLAARAQHLEELIRPALAQGKVVLCDRFNDSTVAYQGYARGLGSDYVQILVDTVCEGLTPDLTFYFDIDPELGLKRTRSAEKENAAIGDVDVIEAETLEFHQQVRKGFLEIVKNNASRCVTIDASRSIDSIADEIRALFVSLSRLD